MGLARNSIRNAGCVSGTMVKFKNYAIQTHEAKKITSAAAEATRSAGPKPLPTK
jgi:hypothetical protein